MIPKIIHQTWKNTIIPTQWQDSVDACKKRHADYEYKLWTDDMMDDFVQLEYPDFYPTYKSYKYHIQRCDAFRYLILYKYGGIYLDMDIFCKKKLETFLQYDFVVPKSSNFSVSYTNSFFMVVPHHPFIKFCIDNLPLYVNSYNILGKHIHIMNSTGPLFLTKMIKKYGLNNIPNHYILTSKEFAGDCSVCNNGSCKGGGYFAHVEGKSWNSSDSEFYNFCLCSWKKILFFIVMIIVCYYLFFIRKRTLL
jgi:mannosyltransferase OCH1-like enzyme